MPGATGDVFLGYQNFLALSQNVGGGVTVSTEDALHPVENLWDRHRFTRWQSDDLATATHDVIVDCGETALTAQSVTAYVSGDWDHTFGLADDDAAQFGTPQGLPDGIQQPPNVSSFVEPNSVSITFPGPVVITDDGAGNLTGTGVSSGTINYVTGVASISWSAAPSAGDVTADWIYEHALLPNYLCITDLKMGGVRRLPHRGGGWNLQGFSIAGAPSAAGTWIPNVKLLNYWPVIFAARSDGSINSDPDGAALTTGHRFWRFRFQSEFVGENISCSNIMLGRVVTLSQRMAPGFDPWSIKTVSRKGRSRGGVSLGVVLERVEHSFAPKFGRHGLTTSDFHGGGGGNTSAAGTGPSFAGILADASLDRFVRGYLIPQWPVAAFYDGPDGADVRGWGTGGPRLRTRFTRPLGREFGFQLDLDTDNLPEADL